MINRHLCRIELCISWTCDSLTVFPWKRSFVVFDSDAYLCLLMNAEWISWRDCQDVNLSLFKLLMRSLIHAVSWCIRWIKHDKWGWLKGCDETRLFKCLMFHPPPIISTLTAIAAAAADKNHRHWRAYHRSNLTTWEEWEGERWRENAHLTCLVKYSPQLILKLHFPSSDEIRRERSSNFLLLFESILKHKRLNACSRLSSPTHQAQRHNFTFVRCFMSCLLHPTAYIIWWALGSFLF